MDPSTEGNALKRTLFEEDHEMFREMAAEFNTRAVAPHYAQWDQEHIMSRGLWTAAGEQGLLGLAVPEDFGGMGMSDYRFRTVLDEEFARSNHLAVGLAFHLHDDMVLPHLLAYGSEDLKGRWLPGMVSGEKVTSIAWTEPGAGSDLRGIRTRAVRDGDDWLISGQKTFIGNGISGDASLVWRAPTAAPAAGTTTPSPCSWSTKARATTPASSWTRWASRPRTPRNCSSITSGFRTRTSSARKAKACSMPPSSSPRAGSRSQWPAPPSSAPSMRRPSATRRTATPSGSGSSTSRTAGFELADILTEVEVTETYVDQAIRAFNAGELDAASAARAKLWASERAKSVTDRCLQLHGGYGYILEYPVAQAFLAARLLTIFGGTNEIMRDVVGRTIAD